MEQKNPLGELPVPVLLRRYALPSILAMLVSALYNIVDQFFIGRSVGELGNAATNVAFPLSTSCVALALLFGIGGAAAFNLTMGKGEKEKALFYIGNAATMLFLSGVVLTVITELFLEPLLVGFGSPQNVLPYAKTYTGITAIGFPFLILSAGGGHLIRADGRGCDQYGPGCPVCVWIQYGDAGRCTGNGDRAVCGSCDHRMVFMPF